MLSISPIDSRIVLEHTKTDRDEGICLLAERARVACTQRRTVR
jgi:hypothetical protein